MKKILLCIAVIIFWSTVAIAEEPFLGEWEYKDSEKSVIYTFGPGLLMEQVGQGKITVFSSKQKKLVFPFLYAIERKISAESSVDKFWEYILKIWFPSQKETIEARIVMQEGKVSIFEGNRNLALVRKE